jgi:hypothetical protein
MSEKGKRAALRWCCYASGTKKESETLDCPHLKTLTARFKSKATQWGPLWDSVQQHPYPHHLAWVRERHLAVYRHQNVQSFKLIYIGLWYALKDLDRLLGQARFFIIREDIPPTSHALYSCPYMPCGQLSNTSWNGRRSFALCMINSSKVKHFKRIQASI